MLAVNERLHAQIIELDAGDEIPLALGAPESPILSAEGRRWQLFINNSRVTYLVRCIHALLRDDGSENDLRTDSRRFLTASLRRENLNALLTEIQKLDAVI